MSLIYFVLAVLGSAGVGWWFGKRLVRRSDENMVREGRQLRLRIIFGVVVAILCVGTWIIYQHLVVLGVVILVVAFVIQLIVLLVVKTKSRRQQ